MIESDLSGFTVYQWINVTVIKFACFACYCFTQKIVCDRETD